MNRRAYLSVSNADGLVSLAQRLNALGIEITANDGTAKLLQKNDIDVVETENPREQIDLYVLNLPAPGKELDLDTHALIRHAAKKYKSITLATDPKTYDQLLGELEKNRNTSESTRRAFAIQALRETSDYDLKAATLLAGGKSKSESQDRDATLGSLLVSQWAKPAAAFVKYGRLCGAAQSDDLNESFINAFECDPKAVPGSVLILNRPCPKDLRDTITQKSPAQIIEAVSKPSATNQDLKTVSQKEPNKKIKSDILFGSALLSVFGPGIAFLVKDSMTLGIASGALSVSEAAEDALRKSHRRSKDSVFVTDIPLGDPATIDRLAKAGIVAILQPGGTAQDKAVVKTADKNGLVMVYQLEK